MRNWLDRNIYRDGNAIELLQSGSGFFTALESLIISARHFIHIQVYIFDADSTGIRIIELLKQAAGRGVKIYIVVDGYASQKLSPHHLEEFTKAGIVFKKFSPIHAAFRFHIGSRMHHKIVLADGLHALVGGINIAEKYEGNEYEPAWLDFALKLEGPICVDVLRLCENMWKKKVKAKFRKEYHHQLPIKEKTENIRARLLRNDWTHRYVEISRAYRQNLRKAEHSVVIVASYFLPGTRMRNLIRKASARDVKIKLMLTDKSDVLLAKLSANYLYPFLLRHNVEVYEWKPSVLHAKMMIVDEKWITLGSYNLNALSDYGSLELNVASTDAAFAQSSHERILKLMDSACSKVVAKDYRKQQHAGNMLIYWIGYQLTRILFKIYFLLMRRRKSLFR